MSDNALHSDQTIVDGIHISHAFEYVNAAARIGATVVAADIGKMARQLDDGTFYILKDIAPTWLQVGGSGSSGFQDDGVVVRLVTVGDDVALGDTVMSGGGEKLRVVGDSRLEGVGIQKTHATHAGSEAQTETIGFSHPPATGFSTIGGVTIADNSTYTVIVRVQARDDTGNAQLVHHIRCMVYRESAGASTLGPAGVQTDFIDKDNGGVTWAGLSVVPTATAINIDFATDGVDPAQVSGTVEYQRVSGP